MFGIFRKKKNRKKIEDVFKASEWILPDQNLKILHWFDESESLIDFIDLMRKNYKFLFYVPTNEDLAILYLDLKDWCKDKSKTLN